MLPEERARVRNSVTFVAGKSVRRRGLALLFDGFDTLRVAPARWQVRVRTALSALPGASGRSHDHSGRGDLISRVILLSPDRTMHQRCRPGTVFVRTPPLPRALARRTMPSGAPMR